MESHSNVLFRMEWISYGMCNIWKGQAQSRHPAVDGVTEWAERERPTPRRAGFHEARRRRALKSKIKWKGGDECVLCVQKGSEGNCFCEWGWVRGIWLYEHPLLPLSSGSLLISLSECGSKSPRRPRIYSLFCFSKEETFCSQSH